jgi:hypothetical protein
MTATENESPVYGPMLPKLDPQETLAALDRGELLRILADVEAGRLSADEFLQILNSRESRHPFRQLLHFFLNR